MPWKPRPRGCGNAGPDGCRSPSTSDWSASFRSAIWHWPAIQPRCWQISAHHRRTPDVGSTGLKLSTRRRRHTEMSDGLDRYDSCVWCGQAGTIEQLDLWIDHSLESCTIVLCPTCSYLLSTSGDVV